MHRSLSSCCPGKVVWRTPFCFEVMLYSFDLSVGRFRCEQKGCSGLLRPAVVWFGETLDSGILAQAERVLDSCDLCLVVSMGFVNSSISTSIISSSPNL